METMLGEINRLRKMNTAELQREWERVFGSPARTTNHQHLWRKLAWELQARVHGGLSDRARQRLVELGEDAFVAARGATQAAVATDPAPSPSQPRVRDLRLPVVGSVITKTYRGHELRVVVRDGGFEFDGAMFPSLTALARRVTGCRSINGKLFFGLTERTRKR